MVRVAPFHALRYDAAVAGPPVETSAPAYSDVDRFDYATHRTANPYTVLELLAVDPAATAAGRHATARATLERWRRTGVLVTERAPGLAVYRQHDPVTGHVQQGIVGALDLGDIEAGRLLLHEHVDEERARMRAVRLTQVPVDLSPVVALHLGAPEIVADVVEEVRTGSPTIAMVDEQDATHALWLVHDPAQVEAIRTGLSQVPAVLADGHHRVAAARHGAAREGERHAQTLGMVVDATRHGPQLRAVHRLLRLSHADPVARLGDVAGVRLHRWPGTASALADELATASPDQAVRRYGLATAEGCWVITADRDVGQDLLAEADVPRQLRDLDAVVLQQVLYPVIGAYHEDAVADAAAAAEALGTGDSLGAADALVVLRPPTAAAVFAVATAGHRMPAKTTWFWPKPRAGLIMRAIHEV